MSTRLEFIPELWEMYGSWIGATPIPVQRIDRAPNGNLIFYGGTSFVKIVIRSITDIVMNAYVAKALTSIPANPGNDEANSWTNAPKQGNDWVYKVRPIAAAFSMVGPEITNAPLQVQKVIDIGFLNQVGFLAQDGADIKTVLFNGDGTIRNTDKIVNRQLASLSDTENPRSVTIPQVDGEWQIKIAKTSSTVNPTLITGATVSNLTTLIRDQRRSIEDMMDVAKRLSPVVNELKTSEAAYEQAFESDTAPPVAGPSGSLQGFALLFFGISFLSLVLVGCLYAWWFTGSIKNVAIIFGISLAIGLLTMGLLQRYG